MSPFKRTQIFALIRLILPELCDPKAIYRENTKKLFPQPNKKLRIHPNF